jgi:hypothetical protein
MDDPTSTPPAGVFGTFLDQAQRAAGKTDAELAQALDFARVNVWHAIKGGTIKLPVGKVTLLARALNLPASKVLSALLKDTSPELADLVATIWAPQDLSAHEKKLLAAYRHLVAGREDEVEPLVLDGQNIIAIVTT